MAKSLNTLANCLRDSQRWRDALSDLYDVTPCNVHLPDLYRAVCQQYPDGPDDGYPILCTLYGILWDIGDASTVKFIRDRYPLLPPNPDVREFALRTLSEMNTRASLRMLCRLLVQYQPALPSEDSGLFAKVWRSPRHAGVLFPDLLALLPNKYYRKGIYAVAGAAIEAGSVTPRALVAAGDRILQDHREAMRLCKRWRDTAGMDLAGELYAISTIRVMRTFSKNDEVRKALQKSLRHESPRVAFAAYSTCLKAGIETPAECLERFAAEPSTRLDLYELLESGQYSVAFPTEWRNQEAFAEADLVRWLIRDSETGIPSQVRFVEARVTRIRGVRQRVYIYEFKLPWLTRSWLVGISGPQPIDECEILTKAEGTGSALNPQREECLDKQVRAFKRQMADMGRLKKKAR